MLGIAPGFFFTRRMYTVYILQSQKTGRYYIGQSENIVGRLVLHNAGRVRTTSSGIPWRLVQSEQYQTRSDAMKREREIKLYKGGVLFKKLLGLPIEPIRRTQSGEVA